VVRIRSVSLIEEEERYTYGWKNLVVVKSLYTVDRFFPSGVRQESAAFVEKKNKGNIQE
jgi:hypothetical protein